MRWIQHNTEQLLLMREAAFITVKVLLIRKVNYYDNKMDRNKIDTVASFIMLLKYLTILLLDDDDLYTGITLHTGKDFLEAKLTHYLESVLQLTCNIRPLTLHITIICWMVLQRVLQVLKIVF